MKRIRTIAPALLAALTAGCMATGEAQRPAVVVAALGKAVDALVAETQQRQASEAFGNLPVVVGSESVLAEMLRTRLVERGVTVEVACPAKCVEITLVEFAAEAAAVPPPGQIASLTAAAAGTLAALPRAPVPVPLPAGMAGAALVTFSVRDANRYSTRQQVIAGLAIAKSPDAAR